MLDDFKKTLKKTDDAITNADAMITEDRPDIHSLAAEAA